MKKYLNLRSILLIIIVSFTLHNCNTKNIIINDIKEVKLGGINADKISLNIKVPIVNPNTFKIKIVKYRLNLKINEQNFSLIEHKKSIIIPRKFKGTISFPIELKGEKVFSFRTIKNLYKLFSSKKAEVEIIGTVKIKVMCIPKKIKINEKRVINF